MKSPTLHSALRACSASLSSLLHLDNVIVTPHNAGMTDESVFEMVTATAHQWIDIFDGKVPPRMVNPEAWPLYSERFEAILGFRPAELPT